LSPPETENSQTVISLSELRMSLGCESETALDSFFIDVLRSAGKALSETLMEFLDQGW